MDRKSKTGGPDIWLSGFISHGLCRRTKNWRINLCIERNMEDFLVWLTGCVHKQPTVSVAPRKCKIFGLQMHLHSWVHMHHKCTCTNIKNNNNKSLKIFFFYCFPVVYFIDISSLFLSGIVFIFIVLNHKLFRIFWS